VSTLFLGQLFGKASFRVEGGGKGIWVNRWAERGSKVVRGAYSTFSGNPAESSRFEGMAVRS